MAISGNLLTVLLFFPLVGVLAIMLLSKDDHPWIRRISLLVGIVEFLLSFLPVWAISPGTTGYKLEVFHQWIATPAINYHLGVDGISIFLVHLITLLTPIGILASWNDVKHRVKEFHIMLLLLEVGVIGIFLSLDRSFIKRIDASREPIAVSNDATSYLAEALRARQMIS